MKTFYINTLGCIELLCAENKYNEYMKQNGFTSVDNIKSADIVILNLCGGTTVESRQMIEEYQELIHPDAKFIVSGCFPMMNKEEFKKVFKGDVYFGPRKPETLGEFLDIKQSIADIDANTFDSKVFLKRHSFWNTKVKIKVSEFLNKIDNKFKTKFNAFLNYIGIFWYNSNMFFIKIGTGCYGKCSYCAIRFSTGRIRSLSLEKVLAQFKNGLAQGKKEFVLSGEDVGCYGQDIGSSIVELLQQMIKEPGDFLIHVRYIEPQFLIQYFDELCEIFATGKVVSFCSSVQSGSNKILKLMNKNYKIEQFTDCIDYFNKNFPNIAIRTQVIVGFPQETEEDFRLTCRLFDKVAFVQTSVHSYSTTPFNLAANLEGQLPEKVKKSRFRRLRRKIRYKRVVIGVKRFFTYFKNAA